MAYEVTKTIAGRGYRYRVERVRDPDTGKARSRWTYLGRVASAETAPPRARRSGARERLLEALERLLHDADFSAITAGAIAVEAGLAHGTFYRHFRDKRDALRAAFVRVRERRGPAVDMLRDDVETAAQARAALGAFVETVLGAKAFHPSLVRAYFALALRDEEIAKERRDRKAAAIGVVAGYLRALGSRGIARVDDPDATAACLVSLVDGLFRDAIADGVPVEEARVRAAVAMAQQTIADDHAA
jgi:AcrR family transcriptional regulator